MVKTAISPTRLEDYPQWYQEVIAAADLAENSPVRGCMVIKPWGYALWENIQHHLDAKFKATGHVNAYFPLLIPLSYLEKEASHVDGFAKECAVVTHHRLTAGTEGKLHPDGELEEPLVIRPTSETIIGEMYAKWIKSYRDLPVLINQWANIVRWEMRTRLFLRTTEFLWQEGHTAHANAEEAINETLMMLDIYADFVEQVLAIPVIKGEKTQSERFPGAVDTYTIEAMMQDYKALQAATSHFLGQNFAKAANIQYLTKDNQLQHVWTTSWGISTRIIGGLIMTHSDDDGLVLPPRISPYHVVVMPLYRDDQDREKVMQYCKELKANLNKQIFHNEAVRVHIDDRDIRGGEKNWSWIKKGVPLRLEIGLRDIEQSCVVVGRRDISGNTKQNVSAQVFIDNVVSMLDKIQHNLFERAKNYRDRNLVSIETKEEFIKFFTEDDHNDSAFSGTVCKTGNDKTSGGKTGKTNGGFAICYAVDDAVIEEYIKPLQVSARCIPLEQSLPPGKCIFTGRDVTKRIVFAKAY